MALEVSFRPGAREDLRSLYDYILKESGAARAGEYVERIIVACSRLEDFPERGRRRDDIAPGLRTIGFERRALIVFHAERAAVEIVAILYGGRVPTSALGSR